MIKRYNKIAIDPEFKGLERKPSMELVSLLAMAGVMMMDYEISPFSSGIPIQRKNSSFRKSFR